MKMYKKIIFFVCMISFLNLFASVPTNFSVFQEVLVDQPMPVVQLQFPYNLFSSYATTSMSGLVTSGGNVEQGTGMAFISTSGVTGALASLASIPRISYQPGQGVTVIVSAVFDTPVANNVQYIGVGNAEDGFFYGYTGTQFGILHRNASVDTWIPQTGWNGDQLDGAGPSGITLNKQFGNTYKIQYQGFGFGVIKFYVQDPRNGTWIFTHMIKYPNLTGVSPSIRNPSMQLLAVSQNGATGAANVTLKTAAMMGAIEGYVSNNLYPRFCANFVKSSVTTTNQNILSIQNNVSYAGKNNQAMIYPDLLTVMNPNATGGAAVIITLYISPSVSGASYVNVGSRSVVSYDTSGTGVSGGIAILTSYLVNATGSKGTQILDLSSQQISISPGDRLVVAAQSTAGTLNNIGVGLSWIEKQ